MEAPVQVNSRPGSTTANLDFIRALPLAQVKRVPAATGPSRRTSWMAGSNVSQPSGLASSAQTRSRGALMSSS
jgi:hypothetical protein